MSESPPVIPQHLLDVLFGTFLVGTWLGTAVFAFELTQIYRYFSLYPISWSWQTRASNGDRRQERTWIPIMVLWMFALDLVCMIAPYIMAYTWLVSGWGNPDIVKANGPLLTTYGVASAMSIFTMHVFLISRYQVLSRCPVISAVLFFMAVVTCALFVMSSVLSGTWYCHWEHRALLEISIVMWLSCSVLTDWLIVGALTWTLSRIRPTIMDRRGLISRITQLSIISGSIPTILAACCLISYLCSPESNYALVFTQSLASAGTLAVLFNLNSRCELANSTMHTTGANSKMVVGDTIFVPGQLFSGALDRRHTGDSVSRRCSKSACGNELESVSQPEDGCRSSLNIGLELKTSGDIEPQTRSLEETPERTLETQSKEWWI